MTTTDRRDADDATFQATLTRLENTPACDEDTVERVARALLESDAEDGVTHYTWDVAHEELRDDYRRLARAAIAALKPAPGTDTSGQA